MRTGIWPVNDTSCCELHIYDIYNIIHAIVRHLITLAPLIFHCPYKRDPYQVHNKLSNINIRLFSSVGIGNCIFRSFLPCKVTVTPPFIEVIHDWAIDMHLEQYLHIFWKPAFAIISLLPLLLEMTSWLRLQPQRWHHFHAI